VKKALDSRDGVAERLGGLEIEKEYVRRNLTNPAVLIWHRVPLDRDMKARNVELGLHVTIVSVLTLNRLTIRDHLQRSPLAACPLAHGFTLAAANNQTMRS
jgi:hypothetical protein